MKNQSDIFRGEFILYKDSNGNIELDKLATTEDSSVVQKEGPPQARRKVRFYNLDAIISAGYRVNSKRGTQLRIWATGRICKCKWRKAIAWRWSFGEGKYLIQYKKVWTFLNQM